jgi:hypothetical protein
MGLQVMRAIYKNGTLIFANAESGPTDGTEVVVTFLEEFRPKPRPGEDVLQSLRGRGKGERLVERLLQARREDREHDEQSRTSLRA